jgi:hypothetical protein
VSSEQINPQRACSPFYPPGTSQWNKIEHQLFSFISKNWRWKPLLSPAVIVSLIGATTTQTGLKVKCVVDRNEYRKGTKRQTLAHHDDGIHAIALRAGRAAGILR